MKYQRTPKQEIIGAVQFRQLAHAVKDFADEPEVDIAVNHIAIVNTDRSRKHVYTHDSPHPFSIAIINATNSTAMTADFAFDAHYGEFMAELYTHMAHTLMPNGSTNSMRLSSHTHNSIVHHELVYLDADENEFFRTQTHASLHALILEAHAAWLAIES